MTGFVPGLGVPELLIILGVLLLLFGARRLPEIARSLGRSSREFRRGLDEQPSPDPEPPRPDEGSEESGEADLSEPA